MAQIGISRLHDKQATKNELVASFLFASNIAKQPPTQHVRLMTASTMCFTIYRTEHFSSNSYHGVGAWQKIN